MGIINHMPCKSSKDSEDFWYRPKLILKQFSNIDQILASKYSVPWYCNHCFKLQPLSISDILDLIDYSNINRKGNVVRVTNANKLMKVVNINIYFDKYNKMPKDNEDGECTPNSLDTIIDNQSTTFLLFKHLKSFLKKISSKKKLNEMVIFPNISMDYMMLNIFLNNVKQKINSHEFYYHKKSYENFPRTKLLLNRETLIRDGYPLPPNNQQNSLLKDYKFTYCDGKYPKLMSSKSNGPSRNVPLLAVDCEMALTSGKYALIRVSLVDETLACVYDTLVKPSEPITDYLTPFSGIDAQDMKDIVKTLTNVQDDITGLLLRSYPDGVILCGHSLNFDLHALKLFHPYVIDTSVCYNITGDTRFKKSKLRTLARIFLGKDIQKCHSTDPSNTMEDEGAPVNKGHDSIEDAQTVMELVLLKLKMGINFGDMRQRNENIVAQYHRKILSSVTAPQYLERKETDQELYCDKCLPLVRGLIRDQRDFVNAFLDQQRGVNLQLETSALENNIGTLFSVTNILSQGNHQGPTSPTLSNCDEDHLTHSTSQRVKKKIPRKKLKTWQCLSHIPNNTPDYDELDTKITSESDISTKVFRDPLELLRYQYLHLFDSFVTVSNIVLDITDVEIAQRIDELLEKILDTSPSETLFIITASYNSTNRYDTITNPLNDLDETLLTFKHIGSVIVKLKP